MTPRVARSVAGSATAATFAALLAGTDARSGTATTTAPGIYDVGPSYGFANLAVAIAALETDVIPPGSTLRLEDGTYRGSYAITRDVTIEAADLANVVLIPDVGTADPVDDGVFRVDGPTVAVVNVTLDGMGSYRISHVVAGHLKLVQVIAIGGAVVGDDGSIAVDPGANLELVDATVRGCRAYLAGSGGRGGAVAVGTSGALIAKRTEFEDNTADADGGAVWCQGTCELRDSTFLGNNADGSGGAVFFRTGSGHVMDGDLLCDNTAENGGGIAAVIGSEPGLVSHTVFFGNAAWTSGGAVWSEVDLDLANNDFLEGEAPSGAAIAAAGEAVVTTWNGLYAHNVEGTLLAGSVTALVVVQSALYHDSVDVGPGVLEYDLVPMDPDPRFVAYDGNDCAGSDLHLRASSPAIGAGDPMYDDDLGAFPCAVDELPGDGRDGNCDGAELCYADTDGDGFGGTDTVTSLDPDCDDVGEAHAPDDCAPDDPAVHPGALETVANHVDEDCDGSETCWADGDGDAYGGSDTVDAALDCGSPGASAVDTDCDDHDESVFPGAPEVCDGVDQDCSGVPDDGLGPCGDCEGTPEDCAVDARIVGGVCGCGSGPSGPAGALVGVGLALARRRTTRIACPTPAPPHRGRGSG